MLNDTKNIYKYIKNIKSMTLWPKYDIIYVIL